MVVFVALVVGTLARAWSTASSSRTGRMAAFIATLATMVAARGLAQKISGKSTQVVTVDGITDLAAEQGVRSPGAGA